jgi:LPS export ABC transporter protein LptC
MTLQLRQMRAPGGRGAALLLAALAAVAAGGCDDTPQTPQAPPELLAMQPDLMTYETDTYVTVRGIRSAQIHADSSMFWDDSTAVHMHGVALEVYTETGSVRATVNAERGRYEPETQSMYATGNVVLVMPNENRRVESSELWYEPSSERIWSDSASTYFHDGQVTRGTCFKSDLSFRNYQVCNIRGAADVGGR